VPRTKSASWASAKGSDPCPSSYGMTSCHEGRIAQPLGDAFT
jgi:hypothetical protein